MVVVELESDCRTAVNRMAFTSSLSLWLLIKLIRAYAFPFLGNCTGDDFSHFFLLILITIIKLDVYRNLLKLSICYLTTTDEV